jgi:GDPmannose 4,6-dehydratase
MSENRRAIIVGAGGQDGILLQRSLQSQGVDTVRVYRHTVRFADGEEREFNIFTPYLIQELIADYQPNRIYYLAAHHTSSQGHGGGSSPHTYADFHQTHVVGLHHFLEGIRLVNSKARLFYASSSLVFDGSVGPRQSEDTPFGPVGFYGLTKLQGMMLCRHYRREHNLFAACGILYSHESFYRLAGYLSKKIISAVHSLSIGESEKVKVGDLDAVNDWGYAADYVEAFQQIVNTTTPGDYVVATGEGHTVREFAQIVCEQFGLRLSDCVVEDKTLPLRRTGPRVGDYAKLHRDTGWSPSRPFTQMVQTLVNDYLKAMRET